MRNREFYQVWCLEKFVIKISNLLKINFGILEKFVMLSKSVFFLAFRVTFAVTNL